MSELKQFKLPDVGEGLTEADIIKWHVQPGDKVIVNQIIVEIETAKAVVELPSPFAGVVTDLLVPEGATADVGTPIIAVDVGSAGGIPSAQPPAGSPAALDDLIPVPPAEGAVEPGLHGSPAPKQERQAVLVGYGVKLGTATRRARKAPAASTAPASTATEPSTTEPSTTERSTTERSTTERSTTESTARAGQSPVLAKPPVRKLAKDLGIELSALAGTGPNGSITRDDVQAASRGGLQADSGTSAAGARPATTLPDAAQPATVAAVGREERIAIRGVRKHTAAAMTASAFTAPHVTEFLQVDVTEMMAAVTRVKALPEFADVRVSPLLFVARALIVAAARHPMINSSWDQNAQEIVVKHYVNLGIAAATDRGLVVPSIKDAHVLTLPALARALTELAETARLGKATPADLRGGTITITNVGVFGIDTGTPLLSPGEAAILAFGRIKETAWVHAGQLAVRQVTTLALSFDHRIVDGDLGSAVLRDVGAMLEDPLRMLAWS